MKLTYDPRYNIAYLRLHEKAAAVDTISISDELNVDIAPDGTVYGIELLNANEQLAVEDHGKLVVVNEALAESHEISLSPMTAVVREKPDRRYGKKRS
jgi:uncharacterized protein YuzE